MIHRTPFVIFDGTLYRVHDKGELVSVMASRGKVHSTVKLLVEYPGNYDRPEPRLDMLFSECNCPVNVDNHYDEDCSCIGDTISSGKYFIFETRTPMVGIGLCHELIRAGFTSEEILLIKDVKQD
ncbi:MAG: hypothetical protein HQ488_01695 [Parcubacteria group bacterium]|nr:hypothetical protein [Parcubacteria group bacterium]